MSPGIIITAFVVSLLLVFGNKTDKATQENKDSTVSIPGSLRVTSVEELTEILGDAADAEVFIVKTASPVSK